MSGQPYIWADNLIVDNLIVDTYISNPISSMVDLLWFRALFHASSWATCVSWQLPRFFAPIATIFRADCHDSSCQLPLFFTNLKKRLFSIERASLTSKLDGLLIASAPHLWWQACPWFSITIYSLAKSELYEMKQHIQSTENIHWTDIFRGFMVRESGR